MVSIVKGPSMIGWVEARLKALPLSGARLS